MAQPPFDPWGDPDETIPILDLEGIGDVVQGPREVRRERRRGDDAIGRGRRHDAQEYRLPDHGPREDDPRLLAGASVRDARPMPAPTTDLQCCHLIVRGRVQGVAFRAHTLEEARRIGVAGWVRNRPDGSVEAVVEGTPEQLAAMRSACRQGPRFARVDELVERPDTPQGLQGFEIR